MSDNSLFEIRVGIELEMLKYTINSNFSEACKAVAEIIIKTLKKLYNVDNNVKLGKIIKVGGQIKSITIKDPKAEKFFWECKFDSSISESDSEKIKNNKPQGIEITSPPITISELHTVLNPLMDNLQGCVYSNETCGLHIHVDAPQEKYLGELSETGLDIPVVNLILQTYKNQDILRKILKCDRGSEQNPKHPFAKDYSLELLKQMVNISIAQNQDNRFKNIIEAWIDISGGDMLDDNDIKLIKTYDKNWINIFSEGTRYKCINIVPMLLNKEGAQTIENRMPDMELNANRIIANAYFTAAYIEACREKKDMLPLLAKGKSPRVSVKEFLTSLEINDMQVDNQAIPIIDTLTNHLPDDNIDSMTDSEWSKIFTDYQQKCTDCDELINNPPIRLNNDNGHDNMVM